MSKTTNNNGRLGNQIIRNLCVSLIAEKNNLYVDYSNYELITELGINLFIGKNKFKKTIKVNDNNFFEILNSSEDNLEHNSQLQTNIDANCNYFQTKEITNFLYSYLHLEKNKQNIIDVNPFKDEYKNNNDCFIHIRLGDVADKNPGLTYYLEALSKIEFDNLFISSDDKNHSIIKDICNKYPLTKVINFDEKKTIQFGSTKKYIILSHGSFSAIIGYLGFYSMIMYPKYDQMKIWYGDMFSISGWICI
jgi:hypothetical protein